MSASLLSTKKINASNMAEQHQSSQASQESQETCNYDAHFEIPLNEPSICIPRVFPNISEGRVFAIFRALQVGFVDKIDMVPRKGKDGKDYNMVFVHFRNWFVDNETAHCMRQRLLAGEQVKVVYEDPKPWYWKVHAYKPRAQPQTASAHGTPYIDLEFSGPLKKHFAKVPVSSVKKQAKPVAKPRVYDVDADRRERAKLNELLRALGRESAEADEEDEEEEGVPDYELVGKVSAEEAIAAIDARVEADSEIRTL